jgi:glutathione synthase/RimK-type ligase-like ATP-grasp enzyme
MQPRPAARIALVTCRALLPDGDSGDRPLVDALTRGGAEVVIPAWNSPAVDWSEFDLTVLRSCWDYTWSREAFVSWLSGVPRLHNPAEVVTPNTDKSYLLGLADAGLPVIPTVFIAPGVPAVLPDAGEYVLKPSVGAGSRGAGRFDAGDPQAATQAQGHVALLHDSGRTAMLQPYVAGVDAEGETAMIFIDGRFSHAVRKAPMLAPGSRHGIDADGLYVGERIRPRIPSEAELSVAERAMAVLSAGAADPLLYARIDLLPGPDGPVLVEAELTEPSLFLDHSEGAADRLAWAILARSAAVR